MVQELNVLRWALACGQMVLWAGAKKSPDWAGGPRLLLGVCYGFSGASVHLTAWWLSSKMMSFQVTQAEAIWLLLM